MQNQEKLAHNRPTIERFTEKPWELLTRRMATGNCTPFLGAGAAAGVLPVAAQIASDWAQQFDYPYEDRSNLANVAQFIADRFHDSLRPKTLLANLIAARQSAAPVEEPYASLAALPFTAYVTTNYDDLMAMALVAAGRAPVREVCRWNSVPGREHGSAFDGDYEPDVAAPVIYHLHGHISMPSTLVLTDDDYLDFQLAMFSDRNLIPPVIQAAVAGNSLLFLGYRLYDWNFRVLFRRFSESGLQRVNFAVMKPADDASPTARMQFQQQADYFARLGLRIYLGTAQTFAAQVRERWKALGR